MSTANPNLDGKPTAPAAFAPAAGSAPTGLQFALCALAAFRHRHVWKPRGSRKGSLVRNRVKDLSRSGENRDACKVWIADARRAGFQGSIIAQVMAQNDKVSESAREQP